MCEVAQLSVNHTAAEKASNLKGQHHLLCSADSSGKSKEKQIGKLPPLQQQRCVFQNIFGARSGRLENWFLQ